MNQHKLLRDIGIYVTNSVKRRIRENKIDPPTTSKKGGTTLVSSARLMNSITYRIDGDSVVVGTNVKYARIHQEGGIIRPKNAKFLAIPLNPAAKVMSPRDFDNTFIHNGIIYRKDKEKIIPLYKLKRSVEIPARPFLFLDKHDKDRIENMIKDNVRSKLNG